MDNSSREYTSASPAPGSGQPVQTEDTFGIAVWDFRQKKIVSISDVLAAIHEMDIETYKSRIAETADYLKLVVEEDVERYVEYESRFQTDPLLTTASIEYRVKLDSGNIKRLRQECTHIPDIDGDSAKIIYFIHDITKQKQTEYELEQSRLEVEANEEMLSELAHIGYCRWDEEKLRYISVSKGWAAIYGYEKEEFLERFHDLQSDLMLIHPADRARVEQWTTGPETKDSIEYRILHSDGEIRYVKERSAGSFVTLQDITQQKLIEARMIQASKLSSLGEMATSIAHELNQPLNAVTLAAANLLRSAKKEQSLSDDMNRKVERIADQVKRAAQIVNHIRMFGREAKEEHQPIQISDAVKGALSLTAEQLRLEGIKLTTDFAVNCKPVLGHPIRLEQVVMNLLTNAMHAFRKNLTSEKEIVIKVYKEDDNHNILKITDTAGGIPPEILPRIFEPFFTTRTLSDGTGLGLSIISGIVDEMNGEINAYNNEQGATFEIILPNA